MLTSISEFKRVQISIIVKKKKKSLRILKIKIIATFRQTLNLYSS